MIRACGGRLTFARARSSAFPIKGTNIMNKLAILSFITALALSSSAFAAVDYQVTGPVLELTDTKIVVQKGQEKWEIARTPESKVTGELKVGAKVTIHYTMSAKSIEVTEAKK